MSLINHVLHTDNAESHARHVVDGLRAAGHRAGFVCCDRLTINALRGMASVIMIVGPSEKSPFMEALFSASNLQLRSTLVAVRTLDEHFSATAQRLVNHFQRHGGQLLASVESATLTFEDWIQVLAGNLPRPRRPLMPLAY